MTTMRRDAILSYFQIILTCCKKKDTCPKAWFLFTKALQISYHLYLKGEKRVISAECSHDCCLCVVREQITNARMHQWSILNVSMNMRFLCFVLYIIQETEMRLAKRDLMLLLSHLEIVSFPKNFTVWMLHCDSFCNTACFHPPLYLRPYCNYHYIPYICINTYKYSYKSSIYIE